VKRAFTRAVSPRLAECELTHLERVPINAAKAISQHAAYEQALADSGLVVTRIPELPGSPDGVFVEDTAILLDGHAVITRPGADSRSGETRSSATALAGEFELHWITDGHLDGGDVLRIGRRLYVGLSSRTDRTGAENLRTLVRPLGFDVLPVQLSKCLHLKSGATFAGRDASGAPILLYDSLSVDPRQFDAVEPLAADTDEHGAANCLRAGDRLILPAGCARTADKLRRRGFDLVEVDVSELQKAEAGVTCMSLIDERT
jgi:dimethylargininase